MRALTQAEPLLRSAARYRAYLAADLLQQRQRLEQQQRRDEHQQQRRDEHQQQRLEEQQ